MTPATSPTTATGRPDAARTLLGQLGAGSLDEGYAQAADRRRTTEVHRDGDASYRVRGGRAPDRGGRGAVAATLLLVGLLLGVAAVQARSPDPDTVSARRALLDAVAARSVAADDREQANARLRSTLARARQDALSASAAGAAAAGELAAVEAMTGLAPVEGPGLVLTIADPRRAGAALGNDPDEDALESAQHIQDRDLQVVVNGLWTAGAEAVTINDQRLTALTAIRSAGEAVLVGYRPVAPPYVLRAVGEPGAMASAFRRGPGGARLRELQADLGAASTLRSERGMRLSAAAGVTLRHAASFIASVPGPSS